MMARAISPGEIAIFSIVLTICAFIFGFLMESAKSVLTNPDVMIVTRSLSPAFWRKPSEIARTANFVPEYTAVVGFVINPAVDAILTN